MHDVWAYMLNDCFLFALLASGGALIILFVGKLIDFFVLYMMQRNGKIAAEFFGDKDDE